jgi:hypothetical protein
VGLGGDPLYYLYICGRAMSQDVKITEDMKKKNVVARAWLLQPICSSFGHSVSGIDCEGSGPLSLVNMYALSLISL